MRGAARRLHLTPSAMSHALGRIRELLGDEVLVRAGRGMVPTPRAEALAAPVRKLLSQAQAVLRDPEPFSPMNSHRAFRVVCTDYVSTVLLPRVEQILHEEAPHVGMYVCPLVPETMSQLRTGEVDGAIGVFASKPPEMHEQVLFNDRFVTVSRSDHPRMRRSKLSLDMYLAEQHVLVAPSGSPSGPVDVLLAGRGLQRNVARTRPSFLSALWLVAESEFLLTVSRRIVTATATRLPVRIMPTPLPVTGNQLSILWHPRVADAEEDAWFRGVIQRAAATLPKVGRTHRGKVSR